jgi:hypothetical protein
MKKDVVKTPQLWQRLHRLVCMKSGVIHTAGCVYGVFKDIDDRDEVARFLHAIYCLKMPGKKYLTGNGDMIILFAYIDMIRAALKHIKKNLTKEYPLFKIEAKENGYMRRGG